MQLQFIIISLLLTSYFLSLFLFICSFFNAKCALPALKKDFVPQFIISIFEADCLLFSKVSFPKYCKFVWIKSKLMLHFSTWVDKLLSSIETNFSVWFVFIEIKNYLFFIGSPSRSASHQVWYAIFIFIFFFRLFVQVKAESEFVEK